MNSKLIEWLSDYNADYDVANGILYIRKPIRVIDFIALKEILEDYRHKLYDIIVEE